MWSAPAAMSDRTVYKFFTGYNTCLYGHRGNCQTTGAFMSHPRTLYSIIIPYHIIAPGSGSNDTIGAEMMYPTVSAVNLIDVLSPHEQVNNKWIRFWRHVNFDLSCCTTLFVGTYHCESILVSLRATLCHILRYIPHMTLILRCYYHPGILSTLSADSQRCAAHGSSAYFLPNV